LKRNGFGGIRGTSSAFCFGFTCFKGWIAVKKILTFVALVGFITVLGCNDAKTSSSSTTKTQTTTDTTKKTGDK
jgi:hypothetical protein